MKKFIFVLAFFMFVGVLTAQNLEAQFLPFMLRHPLEGELAPDFTLNALSGKKINLGEFRDGQPAILFFWATWCPHCRTEIKELSKRIDELEDEGIKFMFIDMEEPAAQVRNYLDRERLSVDVLLDEEAIVATDYEIMGVPSYFVVDGEGIVRSVEHAFPEDYKNILK